jgi:glucosamine--fructose-6-phosphate aminotransferase (isomerizing)
MTGAITWRELVSQPERWARLLARLDAGALPGVALAEYDEVLMLGSGTSYYLALAAADWVRRRHAVPVRAVPSCEVLLDPRERAAAGRRLVIAFSRSGESSELIIALDRLRGSGTTVLGIGCVADSSLMAKADVPMVIAEGAEDGLVMLRSFTSMLIACQYLFASADDRAALRTLATAGAAVLRERTEELRTLATSRDFDRFVFLASGADYPIALEAGLKIQEMSISTSETYHSLEYRHGPKATADANTLVTLFALSDEGLGLPLARDLKALGVTLLVVGVGAEHYDGIADLTVATPAGLDAGAASVLSLLPLQIVAHATALRKGKDPDAPENLSKVVILEEPGAAAEAGAQARRQPIA